MRISLDPWAIAGLLLAGGACFLLFAAKATGLPSSLGWWAFLALATTLFGREAYRPKSNVSDKSIPKAVFWLGVVVVALGVWRTLA
jgi:hypothetical protein